MFRLWKDIRMFRLKIISSFSMVVVVWWNLGLMTDTHHLETILRQTFLLSLGHLGYFKRLVIHLRRKENLKVLTWERLLKRYYHIGKDNLKKNKYHYQQLNGYLKLRLKKNRLDLHLKILRQSTETNTWIRKMVLKHLWILNL